MTQEQSSPHLLTVAPSPHMHSDHTTARIMLDVIIALIPLLIWGCYNFGMRALTVTLVSVLSSVLFEFLYTLLLKKPCTVGDLSAVVTGILLAYNMPTDIPLWMPIFGAFFAIIVVKMLFGGLGKNFVNPALAGRAAMLASFSSAMSIPAVLPKLGLFENYVRPSVYSTATPLSLAIAPDIQNHTVSQDTLFEMFIGNESGTIGEVSAFLILISFAYLLIRKVISWHIPVTYLGTVAAITFLLPANGFTRFDLGYTLAHLLSGGLMLAAVFMATDYVTCPITKKGRMIFGVGCGILTVLVRYYANTEGASYAILTMNLLVYYIDKITVPRPFGTFRKKKAKGENQ